MPFWFVKFNESPEMKPELIATVAPASVVLEPSVTVSPESRATAEPPLVKVADPPALTTGPGLVVMSRVHPEIEPVPPPGTSVVT